MKSSKFIFVYYEEDQNYYKNTYPHYKYMYIVYCTLIRIKRFYFYFSIINEEAVRQGVAIDYTFPV